jgi:hypothetical protein
VAVGAAATAGVAELAGVGLGFDLRVKLPFLQPLKERPQSNKTIVKYWRINEW